MSAVQSCLRLVGMVLAIGVVVGGVSQGQPLISEASANQDWQEVTRGNLVLEVHRDWQPYGSAAPDEGRWRLGAGAANGTVKLVRDRPFERIKIGMRVDAKEAATLAGRRATRYSGRIGEDVTMRRVIAVVQDDPDPDGGLLAIICEGADDSWDEFEPAFRRLLYTAHAVGAPRPEYPPKSVEKFTQWYTHGRGGFQVGLLSGWRVETGQARDVVDADFDTIYDDSGTIAIVMGRVREQVSDADAGLERWRKERLSSIKQEVHEDRTQLAGLPALRLSYLESNKTVAVSRISVVAFGYRYPITVYAPASAGIDKLPSQVGRWLDGIEFLHSPERLARWQTVSAGPVVLRLPPDWKPLERGDSDSVLGRWGIGDNTETKIAVSLEGSLDPLKLRENIATLQRMFPVRSGNLTGYAYCGRFNRPVGQGMTVILDATDDQDRFWAITFRAVGDEWSRYEWEASRIVDSMRISGLTPRIAGSPPRLGKELATYDRIPGLRGEHAYRVTSYVDGLELQNLGAGKSERARIAFVSMPAHEQLQPILDNDAQLAKRLGPANGDRISLFDDAVRVQLFEGGLMLTETATRYTWWCTHRLRTAP